MVATPSRISSLSLKWWYSEAPLTPSASASRRMLRASSPSASAMRSASSSARVRRLTVGAGAAAGFTIRPAATGRAG